MTQMTHWPGDPMTQFHLWQPQVQCIDVAASSQLSSTKLDARSVRRPTASLSHWSSTSVYSTRQCRVVADSTHTKIASSRRVGRFDLAVMDPEISNRGGNYRSSPCPFHALHSLSIIATMWPPLYLDRESKNKTPNSWPLLHQLLSDFQFFSPANSVVNLGHGIFLYGRCKQLSVSELNSAYFSRHLF